MPIVDIAELPAKGALLALDPGARRIGVAACDADRILASPVQTITRSRFAEDAKAIFAAYDSRVCAGLVIGLPLNMDGGEGPRAQSARALARNLLRLRDIPIAMHDERLTSMEAGEMLKEAGVRAARRGAAVDQLAAALILKDAMARMGATPPAD